VLQCLSKTTPQSGFTNSYTVCKSLQKKLRPSLQRLQSSKISKKRFSITSVVEAVLAAQIRALAMLTVHRGMKRSRSVRVYVVRLVVAVAVPLLLFGAWLRIRSAENEQRSIATTVEERAHGLAADLDRELRNLQDLVSVLASSRYLFLSEFTSSRHHAKSLKNLPLGLVLRDLSGEPLFDTCTGDNRRLPISAQLIDTLYTANAVKSQISELEVEPISGEAFLTVDLPIWRDDESVLILSLCALPSILRILIDQHLPDGWMAAVVDRGGRPIASVKQSADGSFVAVGDHQAMSVTEDGTQVIGWAGSDSGYTASSSANLAGWTVAVSVPGEIFSRPVRRASYLVLLAGGGTLALVLVLTLAVGRRIAGSLTHLAAIAKTLGNGGQPEPPRTGINEADLIATVLCSTGENLNRRTLELTQTVEALRHREKQLRTLSDDLRRALDERRELLNCIVSAQESERQRIARELHDRLGQYLAAMLLGLNAASKVSNRQTEECHKLADLQSMTLAMSREVHQLSWELRPTALDDLGLEAAIANYLEKWRARFDLHVDFVSNLQGKRLSPPVEITLYRVLQEAMTNVAKHAHAARVSVVLDAGDAEVRLVVEDDGTGFVQTNANSPSPPTSGFGVLGIRERLALVRGSLIIEPVSDHGTALFCRIPA
jgi:signal transduction histidine kinase